MSQLWELRSTQLLGKDRSKGHEQRTNALIFTRVYSAVDKLPVRKLDMIAQRLYTWTCYLFVSLDLTVAILTKVHALTTALATAFVDVAAVKSGSNVGNEREGTPTTTAVFVPDIGGCQDKL